MPSHPDAMLTQFREMSLFASLPPTILQQLAERCLVRWYQPGQVVFQKNDPGASMYIIISGTVLIHDGEFEVVSLRESDYFGELSLLDEGLRSLSATCTQPAELAIISKSLFFEVLGPYPDVFQKIVGSLTERLRIQTENMINQLRNREKELTQLVEERTVELHLQIEQAEREKREAEYQRQRAEQSERLEQQFLANMSHEIRTPMNAVLGMTNLLMRKKPREDQTDYLMSIQKASESLLVILNDILDISKIQAGRLDLETVDFSLEESVQHICRTLDFIAHSKGLNLSADIGSELPPVVKGDPLRLQQILMNLVGNGIKFTEKGSVQIGVKPIKDEGDTVLVRFDVTDTGIGMSENALQFVFDKFRQASSETSRKFGGTGLGLSIARQLVELFGGSLEVTSIPDQGSNFFFTVPFLKSSRQTTDKKTEDPSDALQHLKGLRILLAEDNEYNRIVAEETLGYLLPDAQISTAENGRKALELLEKQIFDVVLMDVSMPELDGLEATRMLRSLNSPNRNVPVIAFTAYAAAREQKQCLDAGMNCCITKPFRETDLAAGLLKVLRPHDKITEPSEPEAQLHASPFPFIHQLSRGDVEKIKKYLGLYLESAEKTQHAINVSTELNDIRRAVHAIKPQFKMIDMPELANLASDIENTILDNADTDALPDLLLSLNQHIQSTMDKVKNYLSHI
ncbi:MAG: response regulator [Saprospiraceae bacterium]|nr:response regulator [Saprospiraceae bacterium]